MFLFFCVFIIISTNKKQKRPRQNALKTTINVENHEIHNCQALNVYNCVLLLPLREPPLVVVLLFVWKTSSRGRKESIKPLFSLGQSSQSCLQVVKAQIIKKPYIYFYFMLVIYKKGWRERNFCLKALYQTIGLSGINTVLLFFIKIVENAN